MDEEDDELATVPRMSEETGADEERYRNELDAIEKLQGGGAAQGRGAAQDQNEHQRRKRPRTIDDSPAMSAQRNRYLPVGAIVTLTDDAKKRKLWDKLLDEVGPCPRGEVLACDKHSRPETQRVKWELPPKSSNNAERKTRSVTHRMGELNQFDLQLWQEYGVKPDRRQRTPTPEPLKPDVKKPKQTVSAPDVDALHTEAAPLRVPEGMAEALERCTADIASYSKQSSRSAPCTTLKECADLHSVWSNSEDTVDRALEVFDAKKKAHREAEIACQKDQAALPSLPDDQHFNTWVELQKASEQVLQLCESLNTSAEGLCARRQEAIDCLGRSSASKARQGEAGILI